MAKKATPAAATAAPTTEAPGGSSKTIFIVVAIAVVLLAIYFVPKMMKGSPAASAGSGSGSTGGATPVAGPTTSVSSNGFVSDAAVAKRKAGTFVAYSPNLLIPAGTAYARATPAQQNAYNAYISMAGKLLGTSIITGADGGTMDNNEKYASSFLQGMNLAQTPANLAAWTPEIQAYIANPAHQYQWEGVTTGQFLQ